MLIKLFRSHIAGSLQLDPGAPVIDKCAYDPECPRGPECACDPKVSKTRPAVLSNQDVSLNIPGINLRADVRTVSFYPPER